MGCDKCDIHLPWQAYKASAASSREYVRLSENKKNFIALAAENITGPNKNLLAFSNEGGCWKTGVSFQHARFQRNCIYLTIFRPEKPRQGFEVVKRIIRDLRIGKKVVEIHGFDNLYEFSHIYKQLIQNELEQWQLTDTFTGSFLWMSYGKNEIAPEKLKQHMDQIYNEVCINNLISIVQLHIEGYRPHPWLMTEMIKVDSGYAFKYLDSNTMEHRNPEYGIYVEGDTSLKIYGVKCVPCLRYKSDMMYIFKAIHSHISSWDEQESFSKLQLHYL